MKKMLILGALILSAGVAAGAYFLASCPCDRIPGVALWGEEQDIAVTDWSFANEAQLCQLQVSNGVLPQSLNLNCMSDGDSLFVSCSRCDGKRWSGIALTHPKGKIRIDGKVYPVRLERLTDSQELDHAWQTRSIKLISMGREPDKTRPDHWWSFALSTRE